MKVKRKNSEIAYENDHKLTVTFIATVIYFDFISIQFNVDRNHTNVPYPAKRINQESGRSKLHPCNYNVSSCLHCASTVSRHFFINPTDAHNYKITGMLKQLKFPQLLRHVSVHSGTIIRELYLV